MARNIENLLRQQAALASFGSYAFQETDLSMILKQAASICAASMGVRHAKICRYRPAENDLLVEVGCGWGADTIGRVISKADETSPQGRAFVTGEPVIVRDLRTANGYIAPSFYADNNIVSTVDVLIATRAGQPYGVLEIDSTHEMNYDEHDIDFLTGFANILAEAVATRRREEALRAALREMTSLVNEKDLLASELQHRVRNNLQLISAMLSTELQNLPQPDLSRSLSGIVRKIMSLAEVHEHLLGTGMEGQIDLGSYTQALCNNLADFQPAPAYPVTLKCYQTALLAPLATATALGLALTELVSNCYEHAYPTHGGTIIVRVGNGAQPGEGMIMVSDDGVGYTAAAETRRHGMGLVRRLMQQAAGTLEVAVDRGTTWTMRFPVSPPKAASPAA